MSKNGGAKGLNYGRKEGVKSLTEDCLSEAGLSVEVQTAERGGGVVGRDEAQFGPRGTAGEERLAQLQNDSTEVDHVACQGGNKVFS